VIERASVADAAAAAVMAAAKRVEYESYSPVFWRVAEEPAAARDGRGCELADGRLLRRRAESLAHGRPRVA
jgi:hypothetical protein